MESLLKLLSDIHSITRLYYLKGGLQFIITLTRLSQLTFPHLSHHQVNFSLITANFIQ